LSSSSRAARLGDRDLDRRQGQRCVEKVVRTKLKSSAAKQVIRVKALYVFHDEDALLAALKAQDVAIIGGAANDPKLPQADEISRVIKSRGAEYRGCYDKELRRTPALSGTFLYRLEVATDGNVTRVRPVAPSSSISASAPR